MSFGCLVEFAGTWMTKKFRLMEQDARRSACLGAVCMAPLVLLAGCAAFPTMTANAVRPPVSLATSTDTDPTTTDPANGDVARRREVLSIPNAGPPVSARQPATEAQIAALVPDDVVEAVLSPQTIPQFVNTVFGGVLQVPFVMTSDVATRSEYVSGGTGGPLTKRNLFRLTQQALKQYGVDVFIENGSVIVGNAEAAGIGASVVRDRNTPQTGGRIVQFFPVQTIEVNAIQALLADLFPNLGGARITVDQLSNSLMISGPAREVAQVTRVLREIDQPRFAGSEVLRVEPAFWAADALATSVEQALVAEGFVVSRMAAAGRAIMILSFPAANQILIFTNDETALSRARFWVDSLDQPAALGDKTATFVYQVRNTDAQSIGQLAMGQNVTTGRATPPVGVPGTVAVGSRDAAAAAGPAIGGGGGQFMNGRILVDPVGNRVIFTGTASEFAQLRNLMTTLDKPAPQVVIEVMIAEVTLTDSTSLGVTLWGTEARGDGVLSGGTEGIEIGAGGFLGTFRGPEFRASLNAQAKNDRINILQRPQLVARSGGEARFQVGTDVPIITSQRATDTSSGGNGTDVLQSVQYRQTGVILELKPVVYGDRVDITISQENSSAGAAPAGIASPTILNRSLSTQISITDGWTGVLGGLIANNYNKVNTGIPFLKDIPVVGSAFQSNTVEGDRTELLVLITPYIIRGDEDMSDFAERYSADINAAFRTGRGWSYTLTPFSFGGGFRGIGLDLPSPARASERPPLFPRRNETPEPQVESDPVSGG